MKKKVIIGSVFAVIAIIVIIVISVVTITHSGNEGKKKKDNYTKLAEDFIIALKSEENMEDFLEKNMDFKGMYAYVSDALYEAESAEDYCKIFEKIRNDASEEEIEETTESYVAGFKHLVEYGFELTLKDTNINNPKDYPDFTIVDAIYEEDGEKISFSFDFYKGKLIMITSGEGMENIYEDTAYYSGDEDIPVNLSIGEKRKLNKEIDKHFDGDSHLTGLQVKSLIDSIIKVDKEYMKKDVFVGLYVNVTGKDTWDVGKASEDAKKDKTEENIKKAIEEMEKVKEALDDDKEYYVLQSLNHGIILNISVSDEED